tara:strand:- start:1465 stop:3243 length:1779 start_codon:yes stop_codon:yes gene_type:complete
VNLGILIFFIVFLSNTFCQEETWAKTPLDVLWSKTFKKMTFRDPLVFTPLEMKAGYFYYGDKSFWQNLPYDGSSITDTPVLLDSSQFGFNILDNISNRRGIFIEIDFLRTNLPHFIFHQNYFDLQFGLGLRMSQFLANANLPTEPIWESSSSRGNYNFKPYAQGINFNTSMSWQYSTKRSTYLYHSIGNSQMTFYESEGGDLYLNGTGLSESFGIGTKFIRGEVNKSFGFSYGIEYKWNRIYIMNVVDPENISPINGIDLVSSGLFLTFGIQFGGKKTTGDIAYQFMRNNDFIKAAENFQTFLDDYSRHGKRKKALKMLEYCRTQIPYQQVLNGIDQTYKRDYNEAIVWLNNAEDFADSTLLDEIYSRKRKIAILLLDSVKTYKNKMTIEEAERIVRNAIDLQPNLELANEILASLYLDKGNLNISTGNYSKALFYYNQVIDIYPQMSDLVSNKLEDIIQAYKKDAYFAAKLEDLYLVRKSLKSITEIKPEISSELDFLIIEIEDKIKEIDDNKSRNFIQKYIEKKKIEASKNAPNKLILGMTKKEVEMIYGVPRYIDQIENGNSFFEMWTFQSDKGKEYLFFEEDILIKIK